jgi:YgiT-type zinc finger domain-containing protein
MDRVQKEKEAMKCIVCHDDRIQKKMVTEEFSLGKDIVCCQVEAQVCQSCGERYYDRRAMRLLEDMERRVKEGSAELKEVGKVLACA